MKKFIYYAVGFLLLFFIYQRNVFDVRAFFWFLGAIGWIIMGDENDH